MENEQQEILMITSPAGQTAKVILPVQEGDDMWSAIGRAYPEAYDLLQPQDIEVIGGLGITMTAWDIIIVPGQGQALADWFAEIPRGMWKDVLEESELGDWDDGTDDAHPVMPGEWRGRPIEVTYEIGCDEDTAEWSVEEWDAHIVSVRIAEGE